MATILHPLHKICQVKSVSSAVNWTLNADTAFLNAKIRTASAAWLVHLALDAPLTITCDASSDGASAALRQFQNGVWWPLHFFSWYFSGAESRYSAFYWELTACSSVRRFQPFIEGRSCVLITDHKPLIHDWAHRSDPWLPRRQRHLSTLVSQSQASISSGFIYAMTSPVGLGNALLVKLLRYTSTFEHLIDIFLSPRIS